MGAAGAGMMLPEPEHAGTGELGELRALCLGKDIWWWRVGGPSKSVQQARPWRDACGHLVGCRGAGLHVEQGWRAWLHSPVPATGVGTRGRLRVPGGHSWVLLPVPWEHPGQPVQERTGMGPSAGCRCGKPSARPAHVNGTRVRPQRRCPDPRWSPESAGPSPRPRCSITPGWRFGRAPQPGRGAGSSWGTPSLAGGLPASALPWDVAPYRGSQPALGRGIGVRVVRLGVSGRWGAGSAALLPGRWSPRGAVTLW